MPDAPDPVEDKGRASEVWFIKSGKDLLESTQVGKLTGCQIEVEVETYVVKLLTRSFNLFSIAETRVMNACCTCKFNMRILDGACL